MNEILGLIQQIFRDGTLTGLTDAQLLERFVIRCDTTALEELVVRHGPMVLGVCRRLLRDTHAAEDAFQATFLVLVRRARSVHVRDSLGPWIYEVAWRVAERARADAVRRKTRERSGKLVESAADHSTVESDRQDAWEAIDQELNRLPEKYRVPVVLCHLEGLTHEEVARQLGCPPGTVSVRLMRARERLRQRLVRRSPAAAPDVMSAFMGSSAALRVSVPPALVQSTASGAAQTAVVTTTTSALAAGVIQAMMRSKIKQTALGLTAASLLAALVAAFAVAGARDEPQPAKTLVGKIIDEQGRPVPGADVWLPIGTQRNGDQTAHAIADAKGRFTVAIRQEWLAIDQYRRAGILWAIASGHSLAVLQVSRSIWGDEKAELTVRLGPATDTAFVVLGPDNRPLAGARVEPEHVKTPMAYMFPPQGMLPGVGGVTDAQGRVRMPALAREGLLRIAVETEAFGRQTIRLRDQANEAAERTIRLRSVGRVEGRVSTDRPEVARGIDIVFTTEDQGSNFGQGVTEGQAHVVTDDHGRFSVPALALGVLRIEAAVDSKLPLRLRLPDQVMVRAGDTTQLDLQLEAAVKVHGVIVAKETKQPLGKATVSVRYGTWRQGDQVTTGPDGKYEAYVVPGKVYVQVIVDPEGYVQLGAPWSEPVDVPKGSKEHELPPIELVKQGPVIAGKLIGGRDQVLANVQVIGVESNRRYGFANTDAKGEFQMRGVPAGLALSYQAWTADEVAVPTEVVSAEPLVLRARFKQELVEEAGASASISVRVVDREGKPVEGVDLILYESTYGPDGRFFSGRGEKLGTTDAQGWCRRPDLTARGLGFRIIVSPGRVALASSETVKADGRSPVRFRPIVVDRLREVAGRVEDAAGRPLPGATVWNWGNAAPLSSATTSDDGAFRLGGMPSGDVFLFAEAPGYRFLGKRIAIGAETARIILQRRDVGPGRAPARCGPALPRAEMVRLARDVIGAYAERALAGSDPEARASALEVLAYVDPVGAWEKIQAGDPTWDRDAAKYPVFRAFLASSPDDAQLVIPRIKSPFWRMHSYQEFIDALPPSQAGRKKELLAEALLEARKLDDPSLKVGCLSRFAVRLADLGETAAARKVSDELPPLLKALDAVSSGHDRVQQLASVLGRIDSKAALALIPEGGDERVRNNVIGAVAEAIAATDPAAAEQLIGRFTQYSAAAFTVYTCRRMAPIDLPRARRMAAAMKSHGLRGYAYGLMSDAVAATDKAVASALLDDSSRAFADAAERGLGGLWGAQGAAVMAASLLPVVERVAPDRFSEFFWRAVSLRWQPRKVNDLTMTIPDDSKAEAMRQGAALALYLTRYDRDLARSLLNPLVEQFLALPPETDALRYEWRLVLMALAQVEPRRAVEVVAAIPDLKEGPDRTIRDSARLTVARALSENLDQVLDDARNRIPDLEVLLREDR